MRVMIREPHAGDALDAGWGRDVAREIAAQRLSVMAPLVMTRTPCGTSLRVAGGGGRGGAAYGTPWEIKSLTEDTLTLTNGCWRRGPVVRFLEGDFAISLGGLSGNGAVIGAVVDTEAGTAELAEGVDEELPADPAERRYVRLPLWRLERADESGMWRVALDLRWMPELAVYV